MTQHDGRRQAYRSDQEGVGTLVDDWPPILDSYGAAALLQCSVSHVQSLARDGIVPANRSPSGRWRFGRDALISWAAGVPSLEKGRK
jgi:hypothetical protein